MDEGGGRVDRPATGVTPQHADDILREQERSNSAKRYIEDRVPLGSPRVRGC